MSKKIDEISIENFKFFYGKESFKVDKKNLLIYGENGAGKSSLYWALYTFMESAFKTLNAVNKYFQKDHKDSLVNKFSLSDANNTASIKITFSDDNGGQITHITSAHDVSTIGIKEMKEAQTASDFLNYRYLSRMYDFRNSEDIDIFPVFEKDLFKFISFNGENAETKWDEIKSGLGLRDGKRIPMYDQTFKDFEGKISYFNEAFNIYLNKIADFTNNILQKDFKEKITIKLAYQKASFSNIIQGTQARDYQMHKPGVRVTVNYFIDMLGEEHSEIKRPHTFLNEAKLTIIFLALRFAMVKERLFDSPIKLLVIDDLLISLNMAYRQEVLNIILKEFNDFQIFIFTHDRLFFDRTQKNLMQRGLSKNWKMLEFYTGVKDGIERPIIMDSQDALQKARNYYSFKSKDLPAAANYLRKYFEEKIISLLPSSLIKQADGQKATFESYWGEFCKIISDYKIHFEIKEDFDVLKSFVMNPLSHYDLASPVFDREVKKTLELADAFDVFKTEVIENVPHVVFIYENIQVKLSVASKIIVMRCPQGNTLLLSMDLEPAQKCVDGVWEDYTRVEKNKYMDSLYRCYEMIRYWLATEKNIYIDENKIFSDNFYISDKKLTELLNLPAFEDWRIHNNGQGKEQYYATVNQCLCGRKTWKKWMPCQQH